MATRAARTLHLVLFGLGVVGYVVFVLPRWWVLTGDIPRSLGIAGRIAAGIPIALAAWPVTQLLQAGLRATPRPPELALRLRAWSALLHVVAGALVLLAAIAEIWLRLEVGAPWLFGVYGAAGAIAVLGALGLYLSFVAERAPAEPKAKEPKAATPKKPKKVRADAKKKPATKRGRAAGKPGAAPTGKKSRRTAPTPDDAVEETADDDAVLTDAEGTETTDAADTAAVIITDTGDDVEVEQSGVLRNKRPSGKSRHRMRR